MPQYFLEMEVKVLEGVIHSIHCCTQNDFNPRQMNFASSKAHALQVFSCTGVDFGGTLPEF